MSLYGQKNCNQSQRTDDSDSSIDGDCEGNVGWANSIAKVLSTTKPQSKKTLVLSRAKKSKIPKENESSVEYGFEIDGEVKKNKSKLPVNDDKGKHRKNVPLQLRVRPSWKEIERERILRKVATRGVVQLFNAVRIQQKDLQHQLEKAGPLDSRQDAILNNISKRKFLDVLMTGDRSQSQPFQNLAKKKSKSEPKCETSDSSDGHEESALSVRKKSEWGVLGKDFMTNKKIKHWDEEVESDGSEKQFESSNEGDEC